MNDNLIDEDLRLILLDGTTEIGTLVNTHLNEMRGNVETKNYIVDCQIIRFANGDSKCVLNNTVRCKDLYIFSDPGDYGGRYKIYGHTNIMTPAEHFKNLKSCLSAIKNVADDVSVIMPFLYHSRQDKRSCRESLDCAMALQELGDLNVKNIITFDTHNVGVENAIPFNSFEDFSASRMILKNFFKDNKIDLDKLMVISPDYGAMKRALHYAHHLGVPAGMFDKFRDTSKVVNGKNAIMSHEYIGRDVTGLDVLVVDDMISSGDSILEVAEKLKCYGARDITFMVTFALFTEGIKRFQQAYENKLFKNLYTTNLSYIPKKYSRHRWFHKTDCSEYLAEIVNTLNNNKSIHCLKNGIKE